MSEQRTVHDEIDFVRSCLDVLDEDLTRQSNGVIPIMSASARLCPVLNGKEALKRLEASYKREIEDAERRGNHAATKAICETIEKVGPLYDAESVGNAVKLREALVLALSLLDLEEGVPYKTVSQKDIDFMKAALAEPARNCDVGTAEDQTQRFDQFCHKNRTMEKCCGDCPALGLADCEFVWAQMPCNESEVSV